MINIRANKIDDCIGATILTLLAGCMLAPIGLAFYLLWPYSSYFLGVVAIVFGFYWMAYDHVKI